MLERTLYRDQTAELKGYQPRHAEWPFIQHPGLIAVKYHRRERRSYKLHDAVPQPGVAVYVMSFRANGPFGLPAQLRLHEIDQKAADAADGRQRAERMMTPELKEMAGNLWQTHRCFRIAQTPEGPELIEYRHGSPNGSRLVFTTFEVTRLMKESDHDRTFHPRLRL